MSGTSSTSRSTCASNVKRVRPSHDGRAAPPEAAPGRAAGRPGRRRRRRAPRCVAEQPLGGDDRAGAGLLQHRQPGAGVRRDARRGVEVVPDRPAQVAAVARAEPVQPAGVVPRQHPHPVGLLDLRVHVHGVDLRLRLAHRRAHPAAGPWSRTWPCRWTCTPARPSAHEQVGVDAERPPERPRCGRRRPRRTAAATARRRTTPPAAGRRRARRCGRGRAGRAARASSQSRSSSVASSTSSAPSHSAASSGQCPRRTQRLRRLLEVPDERQVAAARAAPRAASGTARQFSSAVDDVDVEPADRLAHVDGTSVTWPNGSGPTVWAPRPSSVHSPSSRCPRSSSASTRSGLNASSPTSSTRSPPAGAAAGRGTGRSSATSSVSPLSRECSRSGVATR